MAAATWVPLYRWLLNNRKQGTRNRKDKSLNSVSTRLEIETNMWNRSLADINCFQKCQGNSFNQNKILKIFSKLSGAHIFSYKGAKGWAYIAVFHMVNLQVFLVLEGKKLKKVNAVKTK